MMPPLSMPVPAFIPNTMALGRPGGGRSAHRVTLLLAWLISLSGPVRAEPAGGAAEPEYLLRAWGLEQGLPENSANAIAQTRDGYLWFGTWNGLVRFNGHRFTVFNPRNTPSLPGEGIVNLHADRGDRLWVSTAAGLAVKDGHQWHAIGPAEGWVGNYIRTFAERPNGDLLITTFDGHVLAVEDDRMTALPSPPGEPGRAISARWTTRASGGWPRTNSWVTGTDSDG